MPLIDLQRRMVEVGRIRAGEKGTKGEPRKLTNWRLTSKDKQRLDHAATLWGGTVREWAERDSEYELHTETSALPIMLLPGQAPTSWYELWSKGGCQRRCDGQHEIISDGACLCGDDRECKPYTRLSVLLPDLPGIGSWLLSSTGWNAAAELAGAADLLQRASAQGVLIPARLRLEQRVEVKAGQTRRFAVPVIDVDVSFRDLIAAQGLPAPEQPALPAGYTPVASNGGEHVTLEQGLKVAETQTVTRTGKGSVPIPTTPDLTFDDDPVPVPTETRMDKVAKQLQADHMRAVDEERDEDDGKRTKPQGDALNALYGELTRAEAITVEQIYTAVSRLRQIDVDTMVELLDARKLNGDLSFAKLRDSLTKQEASNLIDRLGNLQANVTAKQ